jgi:predicted metal-dependent hydrolase
VDSQLLARGIDLFNHREFFEAHEILEDVWRATAAENKKCLQGLVQLAVAFHHHSTGNLIGMRSVLERSIRNLSSCSADCLPIKTPELLTSLNQWRDAMDTHSACPALPRIESL